MTVDEVAFEQIFREMGYASSTDYATKRVREDLLRELKSSLEAVDVFEKKYNMTYTEFYRQFNELTQFGLFEREDDIMDWRAELEVIRAVEKRLALITK